MKRLGVRVEIATPKNIHSVKYDGLLLLGGRDVNPWFYGESIKWAQRPDRDRDIIEWQLIRRAMTRQIPIFGICRGHQMITVAHGGSLYQDIHHDGVTFDHPDRHRVTLSGNLAKHTASDNVNSYHHQAVRRVPDGFKVLAKSTDGVVEAIYKPGVLGVQWHPEMMYKTDSRWIELFRWFVDGLE
jgi:putative glutamine amidotransferase